MHLNIEIKARTNQHETIRQVLQSKSARFVGTDRQIDTYFRCENGRLKLRQGNIEQSLIHYSRTDQAGPKASHVSLFHPTDGSDALKAVLLAAYGIWKVVDKTREIYFVDNVKIHLDQVQGLGTFVEIEAIDTDGSIGEATLRQQCAHFMELFEIKESDLLSQSYSDMVEG
ncbi:MAG: class IV adenylate cyclase [Bacteroidota bacterium]